MEVLAYELHMGYCPFISCTNSFLAEHMELQFNISPFPQYPRDVCVNASRITPQSLDIVYCLTRKTFRELVLRPYSGDCVYTGGYFL